MDKPHHEDARPLESRRKDEARTRHPYAIRYPADYLVRMIQGQRVLGVIPARGGSKRVSRKNLRPLAGRPLLVWTIDAARASEVVDRFVVSSEDVEILDLARSLGAETVERPAALASDEAASVDVVIDALDQVADEVEWVLLLQPTSPFRTGEDIDRCVRAAYSAGASAAIAVTEPERSPYLSFTLDDAGYLKALFPVDFSHARSQDLPRCYAVNGAVYAATTEWLRTKRTFIHDRALAYVMPRDRSADIDTEEDFASAELSWARRESIT